MEGFFSQFVKICGMIRIEHSIFALPYAWAGMFLAARGMPPFWPLLWLTLAMICVRSFAMTFNRLADLRIDSQNPRTAERALCTGEIDWKQACIFCAIMGAGFVIFCACLNMICFALSVPVLFFVAFYSFLKRFSPVCHYWLGASLGLAPLAGWLGLNNGSSCLPQLLLLCGVTFWVAAFDIYYSFQDLEFDRGFGLHSIPADWGPTSAMRLSAFSHTLTVVFFVFAGMAANLGWPWYALCASIAVLLAFEHNMVNPDDLHNINTAFFTLNGIIAPLVLAGVILGIYF